MGVKTSKFSGRDEKGKIISFERTGENFAEMTVGYDYTIVSGGFVTTGVSSSTADRFDHTTELDSVLASASLTAARGYPATLTNGSGVGYVCAGATTGSTNPVNTVDKINFLNNTTSASIANLGRSPIQWSFQGYTGNKYSKGYIFGGTNNGSNFYNVCTTLNYETELASSGPASMQQTSAKYGYAVVSDINNAISAGGYTGSYVATADKHNLDTLVGSSQSSANLTVAGNYPSTGGHSDIYGYFLGRYNVSQYNTVDRVLFSTFVTSAAGVTCWMSGNGIVCGNSASNLYGFGGTIVGTRVNYIGRLNFATGTPVQLVATLSSIKGYASAVSGVSW